MIIVKIVKTMICKDNIVENATNPTNNMALYEGEIRPYMFEPMSMNDRKEF